MNYPICALDSTQRFVLCKMWHEEYFYKLLPECLMSTTFTVFYNLNCFHDIKGNPEYNYIQCCTITYNAVQLHTMLYNYIQCCAITYNAVQLHTMQYNYIKRSTITYNAVQLYTMQYNYTIIYNALKLHTIQCNYHQCSTVTYNAVQLHEMYNVQVQLLKMQYNCIQCCTIS